MILLSILSLITTVIGLWLLGNKNKNGFIIFNISLLCQAYMFLKLNNYFLVIQMSILIIFNTRNYFKWKKETL